MNRASGPPEDYLRECSSTSLRYFEMSKLVHVANLRRELSVLLDEMLEESALALFARWMLEKRSEPGVSAGAGANAGDEKARASRRARRLLADFVSSSARAHGAASPDGSGNGSGNGKCRPAESAATERCDATAPDWKEIFPPLRVHAAPPRGTSRSDRQLDRKAGRPGRPCARSSSESL